MNERARTPRAKLRDATAKLRYARRRHEEEHREADIYAEALLCACEGSVIKAFDYARRERLKLARAERLAEMQRPNKVSPSQRITDILHQSFNSARFKISQHAVFFAVNPRRSGFISGLGSKR